MRMKKFWGFTFLVPFSCFANAPDDSDQIAWVMKNEDANPTELQMLKKDLSRLQFQIDHLTNQITDSFKKESLRLQNLKQELAESLEQQMDSLRHNLPPSRSKKAAAQTDAPPTLDQTPPIPPDLQAVPIQPEDSSSSHQDIFTMNLEFLYWTVQQKASTFVLTPDGNHQPYPASPAYVSDALGKYQSAHFDWNPGARAAIIFALPHDSWNLWTQYTFYYTRGTEKHFHPDDLTEYLLPTNREVNASPDGVNEMRSKTNFHYQVGDLLLSRRFLPSSQIQCDLYSGATGAWINEKWIVNGTDAPGEFPNVNTITWNNWHFYGGGIRVGVNTGWKLLEGFSFCNNLSFATLAGSYFNSRKTVVTDSVGDFYLRRNTREGEVWIVPTTQMEFGLNWKRQFTSWSFSLKGAFEINTWYDLHQLHQDSMYFTQSNNDKLDYRNSSPVNLWGFNVMFNWSL
jgi:hypothetical protein